MKMEKTESEWKEKLTTQQFEVLRKRGTEPEYTGKHTKNKNNGMYVCVACGAELFSSKAKFESGTGWPSFYEPANKKNVELKEDYTHGMHRMEVLCKKCGGHLGHVFHDAPSTPTGKRFCINSCSLDFKEKK